MHRVVIQYDCLLFNPTFNCFMVIINAKKKVINIHICQVIAACLDTRTATGINLSLSLSMSVCFQLAFNCIWYLTTWLLFFRLFIDPKFLIPRLNFLSHLNITNDLTVTTYMCLNSENMWLPIQCDSNKFVLKFDLSLFNLSKRCEHQ